MIERETDRFRVFSRRTALLAGGKLCLVGVLLGRMHYLQVLQSDQFQMLAEENRINMRLLAPPRGRILDRFGVPLASNRQNFRVLLVPEQTEDVAQTLDRLERHLAIDDYERERILREVARQRHFIPVRVAENLTWEQFAQINVYLPDLPGVQTDVGDSRHYPLGDQTSHVVGYVSSVAEEELTGDPLLELPGFRIGKSGVEKVLDEPLRGTAGNSRVEVNAYGRVIRELVRQDGQPGHDVVLSIDTGLQSFVSRRLSGEAAAAAAIDIHTGEVLALASTPSFDANAFNLGISSKAWNTLLQNPRKPLTNKAVAGQYSPGSAFKMIVAMTAIEAGIAGPGFPWFCNGRMRLGSNVFHCWRWRYGGHGWVNMIQAIEQSCDIYFYEMARRVGVDRIAEMARRFGLGATTGIELTGERAGLVPTKDWKLATIGQPWQGGETLITGIGQGYLLTTPLQLAVMTARMVNGGRAVTPRLVRQVSALEQDPAVLETPSIGVSDAALRVALEGMVGVVNGKRGTARKARLKGELAMGGKTGTVQVKRITKAERARGVKKNKDRPWKDRDHAIFVGYAPVDEPRYATAVVIEHGGSGTVAALATKDIMTEILARDPAGRPAFGILAQRRQADEAEG